MPGAVQAQGHSGSSGPGLPATGSNRPEWLSRSALLCARGTGPEQSLPPQVPAAWEQRPCLPSPCLFSSVTTCSLPSDSWVSHLPEPSRYRACTRSLWPPSSPRPDTAAARPVPPPLSGHIHPAQARPVPAVPWLRAPPCTGHGVLSSCPLLPAAGHTGSGPLALLTRRRRQRCPHGHAPPQAAAERGSPGTCELGALDLGHC